MQYLTEMLKPRGQTRNLWPWPRPRPRDPLASASSFWSRPRTLIFNFNEPGVLSFRNTSEPPSKSRRTALFGHYRAASQNPNASDEPLKPTLQIYHPHQL